MKNIENLSVTELNQVELIEIIGGDGFWEGVGFAVGYVGGLAVEFAEGVVDGMERVGEDLSPS